MENVSFELYKVFYYVAIHKNLTRAANELYISQPAITQSIKKLEEQIGYTLFYRSKHGMNLTKEGEQLFDYLKTPIECLLNGKSKIKELENNENITIRLGGGTTVLQHNLLKPLSKFRKKHTSIQFIIKHELSKNLLDMLLNDTLDLVILTGTIPIKEDIEFIPIEEMKEGFLASTREFNHLKKKVFSMNELNELPLILQAPNSSTRNYIDQIAASRKTVLSATYELVSYGLVLEFVKSGLGVGFINSNRVTEEIKNNKLFELKTDFLIPSRYVYVAIHKKNKNNKILKEFVEYLKKDS
ncbi:MAG: LysR family transcriptional regulator [Bacilli bacterium]|nr:LysR family transcriptional regulator [Bacilli bacterium]